MDFALHSSFVINIMKPAKPCTFSGERPISDKANDPLNDLECQGTSKSYFPTCSLKYAKILEWINLFFGIWF